jgi:hypothetical protein
MVLTDPRLVLRQYFDSTETNNKVDDSNLDIETGSYARYEGNFELDKRRLYVFFHQYNLDLNFNVGYRNPKVDAFPRDAPPISYIHHLYVQAVCIDKYMGDGSLKVSGTKLADKASQEIRLVIRSNMTGSMRLSTSEEARVDRVGYTTLYYSDKVGVDYIQYVTKY